MPPSAPFVDPRDGTVDLIQVLEEAIPLAKLIGSFALVAFVPFTIGFLLAPSGLALLFNVVGQFVLAVGAAVVLIYCVARGTDRREVPDRVSGDTGPASRGTTIAEE